MENLYFENIKYPLKTVTLEKHFITWFLWECRKRWFWSHKIPDTAMTIKPFDFLLETNEWSYKCEAKTIDNVIFPLRALRDNQISSFLRLNKLWKDCLVLVYSKKLQDFIVIKFWDLLINWEYEIDAKIIINFSEKTFKFINN